jgi:hypothetical protein
LNLGPLGVAHGYSISRLQREPLTPQNVRLPTESDQKNEYEIQAMRVALGIKTHSGWAVLVAVCKQRGELLVVDRRRIELVEEAWQKQPYHAAEHASPDEAGELVKRGIATARRTAVLQMRAAIKRERDLGYQVTTCAVLVGAPMPAWSTAEILAVHFRMHKAEGVLFRDVLVRAARTCKLKVVEIPEKLLLNHADDTLGIPASELAMRMTALGKSVGSPWGRDQKDAALAAWVALHGVK